MISFYDTSTLPAQDMLDAIASAPLGDDVYGLDPTVNELEAVAAGLMGKEAAVLMPSGTMANLAAVLSWTRPSNEVVLEAGAHLLYYEAGGTITSVAVMKELRELCDRRGLALHVDGARIFNAAVALDVPPAELVADADPVFFALGKGLSAPVGAVLTGSADFVQRARRARKMLGGGMRQAGVIAAAGLVALRTGIGRFQEDHEQARRLASQLAGLPGLKVSPEAVETNFVMIDTSGWGISAAEPVAELKARGISALARPPWTVRFVTHRQIGDAECETLLTTLREISGR